MSRTAGSKKPVESNKPANTKTTVLIVGIAVVGLAAAAFGVFFATRGPSAAANTAKVTDAVTAALVPDPTIPGPFTTDTATCAATGLIDSVGLGRMVEIVDSLDTTGSNDPSAIFSQMTSDEQTAGLAAVEGCLDMPTAVRATLGLFGFNGDLAACLSTNMALEPHGRAILESYLVGTDPTVDAGFSTAFLEAMDGPCRDGAHAQFIADLTLYGISADGAACVADAFVAADNLQDIVSVWTGVTAATYDSAAVNDQITATFTDCLTPDELTTLGVTTTTTSTTTTTTTAP